MTSKDFVWWLKGYFESKDFLDNQDINKIKSYLSEVEDNAIPSYQKLTTKTIDLTDIEIPSPKGPKIICENDK
jgi:hypothetical protein